MEDLNFDSDDVGLVEETVSGLYSKMRIGAVGTTTRAQITRRVLGPGISFDDLNYSFDIGYAAEAQNCVIVADVVSSTIDTVNDGAEQTFGAGDLFLISRPDLPYSGVAHAPRLRFAMLDRAIFDRVLAPAEDDSGGSLGRLDHRPVSRSAALQLQRAIAYVRDCVMAGPEATRTPLVVSAASQFLAANILHTFSTADGSDAALGSSHDANPSTLRRAISFIEANPNMDIGVTDIAHAACVTPRALQLAFRRSMDTTPLAYLRRVRLEHAHEQLVQACPDGGTTVTQIALDWGFSNPSRFAQHYRAAYGHLPSVTLRD